MTKPKGKALRNGDTGTLEREFHDRSRIVDTLEIDPATGRSELRRAAQRAAHGLDRMLDKGLLRSAGGGGEDAKRRHEAGTWLLNLWAKCGFDTATICAYGRATGRGEMSDEADEALTWNRKCWRETMAAVGKYAGILRALAMDDAGGYTAAAVRAALDVLADHRGM